MVQADAKGKVALQHSLLWTLLSERGCVTSGDQCGIRVTVEENKYNIWPLSVEK